MCYNVFGGIVMYYYNIENENIIKYEINIDKEKLEKLRREIIEKCSEIKHIEEVTNYTPNKYDYEHIRNYSEKFLRRVYKDDFYGTVYDEYSVKYDYYEHPVLIDYIDRLLIGDTSIISRIINPQIERIDEEKNIIDEQQKIIELLNNNKNSDITKQLKLLKENQEKLKEYKIKKELNKNQVSVKTFYSKVLSCISFKEISKISLQDLLNIQEFLSNVNDSTLDTSLEKVLKLSFRTTD